MKYLKYYLFILIIFLAPHTYALDYNVTNSVTSPVSPSGSGTYTGEEVNGATSSWNVNTRYYGNLQRIRYNIPLPASWVDGDCFAINNTYTITMEMATNDWRNRFGTVRVVPYSSYSGNFSNGRVTFVSKKKIYFTFTIPSSYTTCVDFLYIDLPSNELFTPFTGETNWNLSKITLTDPMYTSGSGSGSGSGSTSSNQDIINNNTQNTENIINNQNDNTSNIIDNNNQNTQAINDAINNSTSQVVEGIDSINQQLGSCYKNIFNLRSPLSSSTATYTFSGNNITYTGSWKNVSWDVPINISGYYTFSIDNTLPTNASVQVYYVKPNGERTDWLGSMGSGQDHFSIYSNYNVGYLRIILYDTSDTSITFTINNPRFTNTNSKVPYSNYNENVCTSKLDSTNDYLTDDSDPTISNSALNDVFGRVHFTDPLSYLLSLPTQLINKIVSMTDTCSSIDFGALYGVHLILPCINLENYLGADLWNILDVILSVGLLAVILKNFYDTISNLLTLGGEKEAKEKFSMPTPMDFLAMILGGDLR